MQKRVSLRLVQLSLAGLFLGFSASSYASGFQLFEANGAGIGDFNAGAAANANDASVAFFNPAALVTMKAPQIQLSAVGVWTDISFSGTDRLTTALPVPPFSSTGTFAGTAQGGAYSTIPSLEAAGPINDELSWGFSVAVPFGLDTNYDTNSFVRYAATQTSVQDIDISPSLGFKVTSKFSLGLGLDADRLHAVFNSAAGVPALGPFFGTGLDSLSGNDATGWGYGWHAGAMYQFTPDTRVGLAYRSKVSYTVTGTSDFVGPLSGGAMISNNNLTVDTTLPATSILSVDHQFNCEWGGEATVMYTQWSVFNNLVLQNVQLPTGTTNVGIPQNFRNTWRGALGATFKPFDQWLFRAGVGYDETPTVDNARNARLPDGNRFATSLGVHYQPIKALGVDVGWTHLFIQNGNVSVTQRAGTSSTTVIGTAKSYADLVGVQLTWSFV
ncbi:MAG TPA: outer membrane protein transport protein [Gammaproteobacteria bacterium]|nr:outer membrane protein transport protein [Gammaproteobacteria bacterium]